MESFILVEVLWVMMCVPRCLVSHILLALVHAGNLFTRGCFFRFLVLPDSKEAGKAKGYALLWVHLVQEVVNI